MFRVLIMTVSGEIVKLQQGRPSQLSGVDARLLPTWVTNRRRVPP